MYDPNDEKTVLSIDEIRAVQDSPEYWMGYVDPSHLLPWVHPANVTGIDLERLSRINRARHHTWPFENVPGVDHAAVRDPDYEDDDDRVRDYLRAAASQRDALAKKHADVEPISGIRHFAALLYMATHWESYFSPKEADRSRMTLEDIQACVDLYEAAFRETPHCHVKHGLQEPMDWFLCNDDYSPELEDLPEFQRFLADPANIARLGHVSDLFDQLCPELAERIAREHAEAAEASVLLAAVRRKAGRVSWMPEGNPLYWTPEVRAIFYFDWTVNNWFETRWLQRARAGKSSLFGWKFHLTKWRGLPKGEPITEELLDSLDEYTSDADALYYLFRHLDEGGEKFSEDSKRVLAHIGAGHPSTESN